MANETTPIGTTPAEKPKAGNNYESLNEFITSADTALTNALLPDVLLQLEKVGYTAAAIAAKRADLQALRSLSQQQQKEYGDQYQATRDYNDQLALLNEDYPAHVALARVDFEDNPAALTALGLTGKRLRHKADYSKQALQFYDAALANADYKAVLAESNIDATRLTAMQAGFTQLEALGKAQTAETGEAQEATAARDKAWDTLENWMSKFYKKARVALKKYPQLMEKIGLMEKS